MEKNIATLVGVVLMFGVFVAIPVSGAVDATLEVEWKFHTADAVLMQGTYDVFAKTYAKCGCGVKPDENPKPAGPGNWNIVNGLPVTAANATSVVAHANANASASVSAGLPQGAGGNMSKLTVTHNTSGAKNTQVCPTHVQSKATYYAHSLASIEGAHTSGSDLRADFFNGNVCTARITWHKSGSAGAIARVKESEHTVHDPITLTLIELETQTTLYSEQIWDVTINAVAESSDVAWGFSSDSGVYMRTEKNSEGIVGSRVSIEGALNSSWLLNPYGEYGASLSLGGFTATGAWENLPWQFTYDGSDIIEATLSAGYMPTDFDYQVPVDLINDAYTYSQGMNMASDVEGSAAIIIPEPATILLLTLGGVISRRKYK